MNPQITAIVPAFNESATIGQVIRDTHPYVDKIIVVDDSSTDDTAQIASRAGATVIQHPTTGYVDAFGAGIGAADTEIIVTLDADGEHPPERIPDIVAPILSGDFDAVFGQPERPLRRSEGVIEWFVKRRTGISGTSSGMRAIRLSFAQNIEMNGQCTCGRLAMGLHLLGARMCSVPVPYQDICEDRPEHWLLHAKQAPELIRQLLRK